MSFAKYGFFKFLEKKIETIDFHTKKKFNIDVTEKLMANSSRALDKLKIRLHFSKLGEHTEKKWSSKLAHFLISVTPKMLVILKISKNV